MTTDTYKENTTKSFPALVVFFIDADIYLHIFLTVNNQSNIYQGKIYLENRMLDHMLHHVVVPRNVGVQFLNCPLGQRLVVLTGCYDNS